MNMRTYRRAYTISLLVGAAFVTLSVLFMLKVRDDNQLYETLSDQTNMLRRALTTTSVVTYGTIVSIDLDARVVQLQYKDRFNQPEPSVISVSVATVTPIYYQSLTRSAGGIGPYDSLSSERAISLGDLRPGEHAAIEINRKVSVPTANYIIAGEPL